MLLEVQQPVREVLLEIHKAGLLSTTSLCAVLLDSSKHCSGNIQVSFFFVITDIMYMLHGDLVRGWGARGFPSARLSSTP